MIIIRKGDDTNAFGQNLLKINVKNNTDQKITKCVFQCGNIQKIFDNPEFPLFLNFTKEETERLDRNTECYLKVYDENGLCFTCNEKIVLTVLPKVVENNDGRIKQCSGQFTDDRNQCGF